MKFKDFPKDYAGLVKIYKPIEITTEDENECALEIVNDLICGKKLTNDQEDYLLEIVEHIEKFEEIYYPMN